MTTTSNYDQLSVLYTKNGDVVAKENSNYKKCPQCGKTQFREIFINAGNNGWLYKETACNNCRYQEYNQ